MRIWLHTIMCILIFAAGLFSGLVHFRYQTVYHTLPTTRTFNLNLNPPEAELSFADVMMDDRKQIYCVALAIYGEGRGETEEGMIAIGYTVVNRTYYKRFPQDTCEVINQFSQFEPFAKGKYLYRFAQTPHLNGLEHFPTRHLDLEHTPDLFYQLAENIFYLQIPDPTNGATYFWSPKVQKMLGRKTPRWAQDKRYVYLGRFGTQKYYNKVVPSFGDG